MQPRCVDSVYNILREHIPSTQSELTCVNEYTFLVAVVLSAQTTDKQVNSVTNRLFSLAQTPQDMIALGYDRLCEIIRPTGYYRAKAKHVLALSEKLLTQFDGKVPRNREDLMSLPGVGRKTANVVLNQLFGIAAIAVDTHVFRVSHRLGLSSGATPDAVEKDLEQQFPEEYKRDIGDLLLLHGRYTCTAKKPKCGECVLRGICPSNKRDGD